MSAAINNISCFNCILGRKEKEINFRKKKSNHIKRKIDVPLGQEMDSDNDDDLMAMTMTMPTTTM